MSVEHVMASSADQQLGHSLFYAADLARPCNRCYDHSLGWAPLHGLRNRHSDLFIKILFYFT
jgi:hypothetical protein